MRVLVLGNEFITEDSLAHKISKQLSKEFKEIVFVHIKDSFQLISELNTEQYNIIILDVVKNLIEPKIIPLDKIKSSSILSAHDFDASFILKLVGENKNIKVIGIPQSGNESHILATVKTLLTKI